jgi:type IV secretion system protein VirD4
LEPVTGGVGREGVCIAVSACLPVTIVRKRLGVELKYHQGQPPLRHGHRLLMMLDEFPTLGRLQIIRDTLPKCAGDGIKAFLAAQNRE